MLTIYILAGTNIVSGMVEVRVIVFCVQVGYIKSQHMEDKSPVKRVWSGSRYTF